MSNHIKMNHWDKLSIELQIYILEMNSRLKWKRTKRKGLKTLLSLPSGGQLILTT